MTDPAAVTAAPADARPAVVVFGDVIDDVIVTPAGEIRPDTDTTAQIERRAGGSAANAAAWFGHLGLPVHFFGHVHASDLDRHDAELRMAGVSPHLAAAGELPTGTIIVILEADRTRTMLTERGANAVTSANDVDTSLLVPGGHLHFTGYSLFSDTGEAAVAEFAQLVQDARRRGASVSVNPGSAGFLADHGIESLFAATRGASVLIPNLDEGRVLTGLDDPADIVDALLAHSEIVALTMGRAGVLAAARAPATAVPHDGPRVHVEAILVDPVDTTGAGDAFSAGFVSSLLETGPVTAESATPERLAAAAAAGVRLAAQAITTLGARPAPERIRTHA